MAKNPSEDPETEALMKEGAEQALEVAKESGVTLDFSDNSIKDVEKILAQCHREFKKLKSEEGFHGLSMMFGAYIGEVVRKKGFGGTWGRDHPQMSEDTFPFYWRDQT